MSDIAIRVDGVSKLYRLGEPERYRTLRDTVTDAIAAPFRRLRGGGAARKEAEMLWALKDVSFEVKHGEVVGIIGRNGAGKSTLLKILSRITEPTDGHAEIRGRVGSLLEVGTGFHPELSGRENIFLNGAILGMKREEILRKFDEIVAFAEVERFIDTPVKHYSSGMYVRLAFAVAAHMETENLIVDEVLAVGDAEFQKKCLGRIGEVAETGRTVIFVSHNMGVVSSLTERTICLEGGRVEASGNSREIVEMYLRKALESRSAQDTCLASYRRHRRESNVASISGIVVNGDRSGMLPTFEIGAGFEIEIDLEVERKIQGAVLNVILKTSQDERVALLFSGDQGCNLFLPPGRHTVSVRVDQLPLAPGTYFADIGINQSVEALAYDVILNFPLFAVFNGGQVTHWMDRPWGLLHPDSVEWCVGSQKLHQDGFTPIGNVARRGTF
jgi:lipopolysaccharide transport system ATP-binding protein